MDRETIGFIGLGNMGLPMALNLVDAGYDVIGHNRSRESVAELEAAGGTGVESARAVAERAGTVLTCLPDSAAVEAVVRGENGVLEGIDGGETLIDTSTISPAVTEELARELNDAGAAMIDAPVSGGREGARAGTLSIMVGGERDAVDANRDVFDTLGETVSYCGGPGAGQVTKACNQIVVSSTMQAVSEALVLAEKAGADLEAVLAAISDGAASCWVLDNRAPDMIRGDFEPGFPVGYQYKDLRIATAAGDAYEAPMPTTKLTETMFQSAVNMGHGDEANTAVIKALETMAGAAARIDRDPE